MIKQRCPFACLLIFVLVTGFVVQPQKTAIVLMGDSIVAQKAPLQFPETGWGTPFHSFFNDSLAEVINLAYGGESTGTYIARGHWDKVKERLRRGDYLLIQFGHNDEVKSKQSYTTPPDFVNNLIEFVQTCRRSGAHPVLITSLARRIITGDGKVNDSHAIYAALVKQVAAQEKVPLIDLNAISMAMLTRLGSDASKKLYNHLAPGEHPNYPGGKTDNTHLNEYGARIFAQLVYAEFIRLCPEAAALQVVPNPRYQQKDNK